MRRRTFGVITGGSGSSKFVTALHRYSEENGYEFGFICNVGDNFWFHSLYVCPDIDIITYALCGKLDERKGWGIKGDSKKFIGMLASLGYKSWFDLGDEDLALSVIRTELIRRGFRLSQITKRIAKSLRIRPSLIPATDDNVQTYMQTSVGKIHLQEFWVKMKGRPKVLGVDYKGAKTAIPNPEAMRLLSKNVIILPANPITSILPTLALRGVRKKLRHSNVVAISPFIGKTIFSGPAVKLMRALRLEPSSYGVASLYSDFLKVFLVDNDEDQSEIRKIR
ncbi:MAG: 2-phospho-L-lactate transferase, partial [Nitrososphaerales archaeon]